MSRSRSVKPGSVPETDGKFYLSKQAFNRSHNPQKCERFFVSLRGTNRNSCFMKRILSLFLVTWSLGVWSQENFPKNGVADERPEIFAFTHATIYQDYQTIVQDGTLLIKNGKVLAAGQQVAIPDGAQVIDLEGKFIYPALVDPYTHLGLPKVKSGGFNWGAKPQYESGREGPYGWNDAINADYQASEAFTLDKKEAEKLRKLGFGSVLSFRPDGVVRGTSVFSSLGTGPVQDMVLNDRASAHYSFSRGSSKQAYPNSIMGMVALLRQTYYDARWYANEGKKKQTNLSLQAFNDIQALPQVFEANNNKLRVLLADKIGDEFGVQYIIKGNGDEYQRIEAIKATGASLIIPVNFPAAYEVNDPLDALDIKYEDLKHWELAPTNPKALADVGIRFAITTKGLKKESDFWKNLRKAVEVGLSESDALKAVTYTPAQLYGMQNQVGSLRKGRRANFFISSKNIFDKKAEIHQTWIHGKKHVIKTMDQVDLSGNYDLTLAQASYDLEISGEPDKPKGKIIINDSTDWKVDIKVDDEIISLMYTPEQADAPVRLSGWQDEMDLQGTGRLSDASWVEWRATYKEKVDEEEKEDEEKKDEDQIDPGNIIYPFAAYGRKNTVPENANILFKNATVWTLEGDGVIENADVKIQNGEIAAVGQNLEAGDAEVIDASGKHITPGIIDEHSHIALSGVNEGSHAITAEVRMYDAVDSEDIDIYRQLAGGVTAAQLLHGSANPVGGQSALVKFRWGSTPEEMRIKGAEGFIKFALGENVKQSNWGDNVDIRFPQTRMGVEQVYMDGFTRAKEYEAAWKKYNNLSRRDKRETVAPRRDLQLEALLEIINRERFISCHSYVQSEINMLMKVAERFGFNVNTFTHILEGYKVADKMAEHGAGGSTFSDWWAYKYEVREAIPYNAALMHQAGVTVAINSDDGEMARRLNQEAAKTIMYGGMSEVEALKTVTLNPAKLLHLDDRMGSIKAGKDGDVVLWNDHPLSIYAKAEMTLVDGKVYYDMKKDQEMREQIRKGRARLIARLKSAKKNGAKTQKYKKKSKHRWDCEEFVIENE